MMMMEASIDNSQQIAQIEGIAESGTWGITNFNDSGQDYTSDFANYNFTFATDGTLSASNGTEVINGTWSVRGDSSSDNDDDDDIEFYIFFLVPDSNNFEGLNDDWEIVSISATKIELIDISGGNDGTDRLTFEKN